MTAKAIRIAGGSAFWGDSSASLKQLLAGTRLNYLMLEYLAEITMALLARARAKSADAGYIPDFITAMTTHLADIKAQDVKVVTNAGGMNPSACARALRKVAQEKGIAIRIATVEGDDLLAHAEDLRRDGVCDWRTGEALPARDRLLSINAYLGATPIAAALAAGADVVITGRGVDSALVLGPLMHEFRWGVRDYDLLAAGSLCGHLIECGPQATGGNFTDWQSVEGWQDIGYPIAECTADGSFIVSKPSGSGGLVSVQTVGEQLLYEIDDPSSYFLPDVTVDLRGVRLTQEGSNQVSVFGAVGRPPPASYKASVTAAGGFRCVALIMIGGIDAAGKATRTAEQLLARCRRIFRDSGLADFQETSVEVIGAESTYGAGASREATREVMLKIAAKHPSKAALEIFSQEIAPASIGMAPGITGLFGGRPKVTPVICGSSALISKTLVPIRVTLDDCDVPFAPTPATATAAAIPLPAINPADLPDSPAAVALIELAHARSGDKGNDALLAVLARKPEYLPFIARSITVDVARRRFAHVLEGDVIRYDVPGSHAFIFRLYDALGGGGLASLRMDPQGKALAQMLLDLPVEIPAKMLQEHGLTPMSPSL
jgi:hypothetical protein